MPTEKIQSAFALLGQSRFDEAAALLNTAIKDDPTVSGAYLGLLLAELSLTSVDALKSSSADITENENFTKALAFADDKEKQRLTEISEAIAERRKILSVYDTEFLENIYRRATDCEETSESYSKNASVLRSIGGYRDSNALADKYETIASKLREKEEAIAKEKAEKEASEREEKRKKSDRIQINIYSVAIAVLSIFLIFLVCYNVFLRDLIKKRDVLDEVYPLTYDDLYVTDKDSAPWFGISRDGVLSFDNEKYNGDGNIVIPDVFENTLVRTINDGAFARSTKIKSVVISDFVTNIGENTFENCTSLTSVTLSQSLTELPQYAFYNCVSLTEIRFSNGIESIGKGAFSGCTSLKELVMPDSLIRIGSFAFQHCSSIEKLTLPRVLSSIEIRAFSGCNSVKTVVYNGSRTEFETLLEDIEIDNGPFDTENRDKTEFIFKDSE